MKTLVWVMLGGAVGTGGRYLVSAAMLSVLGTGWPWGTFTVNLLGSFVLGALAHLGAADLLSPTVRLALTTGMMGGFTTYSTFSLETWTYLDRGAWGLAVAYALATVLCCLVGTASGFAAARAALG